LQNETCVLQDTCCLRAYATCKRSSSVILEFVTGRVRYGDSTGVYGYEESNSKVAPLSSCANVGQVKS